MRRFFFWLLLLLFAYLLITGNYSLLPPFFLPSALEELTIDTYVYYIN